jgi:hypothetical protein
MCTALRIICLCRTDEIYTEIHSFARYSSCKLTACNDWRLDTAAGRRNGEAIEPTQDMPRP